MKTTLSLNLRRRVLMLGSAAMLAAMTLSNTPALAYDVNSTADVNVDANSVIMRNFDVTTYAADAAPQSGLADYTATSDGAIYRFASAAARDAFVANPETYKPGFGGFCAVGAALGKKLDGDPEIFRIHEGKLYVFVSEKAVAVWDEDPAGTLAKAEANWPQIRDKTPGSL